MVQLRLPHQALRPSTRPIGAGAQLWWRYAMKAVCSQRRHGRHNWVDIARYLKIQREYVPLYVMHLRSKEGVKDVTRLPRIAEMDKALPKDVTLHFRKLAHAQDMRLKEKDKKQASADKPPPRTWVSWLGFKGSTAAAAGAAPAGDSAAVEGVTAGEVEGEQAAPDSLAANSEAAERSVAGEAGDIDPTELSVTVPPPAAVSTTSDKEERGFLTADEVQVLEELVQAQVCAVSQTVLFPVLRRCAICSGLDLFRCAAAEYRSVVQASVIESSDPLQLLTRTVLVVKKTSMCLEDRTGVVATLSAHNMQLTGEFYQVTKKWSCSVGSSALVSEDSNIIRTGALSDQEDQFLAVEYVSLPPQEKPEDTPIDHDIRVRMAPSYVTYDVATTHRIQNFFAMDSGDALDLSALGAQASARIREMQVCLYSLTCPAVPLTADPLLLWLPLYLSSVVLQAIAQQQMHAAWSSRPKIQVFLDLHAPKVAMPISSATDTSPATTLIIDLGNLVIASNPVEASTLSPEEAAIYDCYGLVSYDVAVHLVRGRFAWPDMKTLGSGQVSSGQLHGRNASHSRASLDSRGSAGRVDFRLDDYLSDEALAVPLLGHCSTTASLHVAHVSHPTLPLIRIGLQVCCPCCYCHITEAVSKPCQNLKHCYPALCATCDCRLVFTGTSVRNCACCAPRVSVSTVAMQVPEITLHVSPYRLTQLLLVMRILVPANAAAVDPAPWVKAAEYTSNVEILTWQGLVGTSSEWQQRYAVVYRGTLYFMQSEGSPFIMRQVALWQGRRVLPLPEDITGVLYRQCLPAVCDSTASLIVVHGANGFVYEALSDVVLCFLWHAISQSVLASPCKATHVRKGMMQGV